MRGKSDVEIQEFTLGASKEIKTHMDLMKLM